MHSNRRLLTLILTATAPLLASAAPEPTPRAVLLERRDKVGECPGIYSIGLGENKCCVAGTEIPLASTDDCNGICFTIGNNSATACATIIGADDGDYSSKCSEASSSLSASGTTYRTCMNAGGSSSCSAALAAFAGSKTRATTIAIETGAAASSSTSDNAAAGVARGKAVYGERSMMGWVMGTGAMASLILAVLL